MDKYSLAFSVSNLGPKRFQQILAKFENLKKAWSGTQAEYESLGIGRLTYKVFNEFRKEFNIDMYVSKLKKTNVSFVSYIDKLYPASLKNLENPPIGLFCKGNIKLLRHSGDPPAGGDSRIDPGQARMTVRIHSGRAEESRLNIAVVGTRKVTQYGKDVTELLVSSLVSNGVCIVSGLALGVDGIAHRETVSNNGHAIAVLACGVDCCLPSENYSLYSNILKNNGLVISEYPLSQSPNKGTFLARNRIIAALADGVLITEAAKGSGSLVTAKWGLKLNKKVFAVPGQITSRMSDGSLELLKKGAKLVSDAEDILEDFKDQKSKIKDKFKNQRFKNLNPEERKIVSLLKNEEMTIDEIAKHTKLPVPRVFASISNLELKGIIKNNGGSISIIFQN